METNIAIQNIRKKLGLSQEQMAERLFVTRQAVSRWENGETKPNIESLKLISKEFNVTINQLLNLPENTVCQSCGMPLKCIEDFGSDIDGGLNIDYCKYCFQKGYFTHERTIDEMIESNLKFLEEYNAANNLSYSIEEAREELSRYLATLKRWNR